MKALLSLLIVVFVSGCDRDEAVMRMRVSKEDAPIEGPARTPAHENSLHWILPNGWKELPGSGMRLATMLPPGATNADVTVTALPGDVGGELANVNRWRGQIGLPAFDMEDLAKSRTKISSRAGRVTLHDFIGSGEKKMGLVAGTISVNGRIWFFKLKGEAEAVAAARPDFKRLLRSLYVSH